MTNSEEDDKRIREIESIIISSFENRKDLYNKLNNDVISKIIVKNNLEKSILFSLFDSDEELPYNTLTTKVSFFTYLMAYLKEKRLEDAEKFYKLSTEKSVVNKIGSFEELMVEKYHLRKDYIIDETYKDMKYKYNKYLFYTFDNPLRVAYFLGSKKALNTLMDMLHNYIDNKRMLFYISEALYFTIPSEKVRSNPISFIDLCKTLSKERFVSTINKSKIRDSFVPSFIDIFIYLSYIRDLPFLEEIQNNIEDLVEREESLGELNTILNMEKDRDKFISEWRRNYLNKKKSSPKSSRKKKSLPVLFMD